MLLGNHHDAWVFGAVDPLSGSAALTEITRVFGLMLNQGTIADGKRGRENSYGEEGLTLKATQGLC